MSQNTIWWVYVVECSDNSLYTGTTTDVQRRVKEHNSRSQGAKYTRSRRPVKLKVCFPCADRSQALKEEYKFKQLSREKKLRFIEEYCGTCRQTPCDCSTMFGF